MPAGSPRDWNRSASGLFGTGSVALGKLTRPDVTAAVHYVSFVMTDVQIDRFRRGAVRLAINLPGYSESTVLSDETHAVLAGDLVGRAAEQSGRRDTDLSPECHVVFPESSGLGG